MKTTAHGDIRLPTTEIEFSGNIRELLEYAKLLSEVQEYASTVAKLSGQAEIEEYRQLITSGRKIAAIKLYRERHGAPLKAALDYIESL